MKTEHSILLLIVITLGCGTWLEHSWPAFGYAFGTAVGLAWVLGYVVRK